MQGVLPEALDNELELDRFFDRTQSAIGLLFLHDPFCPISARASAEVLRLDEDFSLIDVSRQHDLSEAVASRTGVRHESPQVLALRDGVVFWHASHFDVTADRIHRALSQARQDAPQPR